MSKEKPEKPSSTAAMDTSGKKNSSFDPTPPWQLQGTSKDIDQSRGWWASPPLANTSGTWAGIGGVGCLALSQGQRLQSRDLGSPKETGT